jgi:ribonucleoside-diphosphate reductase alpha chain
MNHVELNNQVLNTNPETGFFWLEKDKEAIVAIAIEIERETKTFDSERERILYLLEYDYYYKELLVQYTLEQIEELHSILYSYQFKFQSYMAISKFYKDYALRSDDRKTYLENYEQHVAIVALYLAKGNFKRAKRDAIQMIAKSVGNTYIFNAGRSRRGEMISVSG